MRPTLLLLAATLSAPAHAASPFLDVSVAASNGSGLVTSAEGGTTFDKERYRISGRMRTSRLGAEAPGTREEYSLRLTRELYFVTVSARFATSPPNTQGAAYHVAAGEASFKFYGARLAPEHPELSAVVWESSGPVPDPEGFDRTWITNIDGVYTNVNHHIRANNGLFILVDGAWQFSLLETYRETTTVGFQGGGNRYNRSLDGSTPVVLQNVIDYWGNRLPISGWANNWQSLRLERKFGAVGLAAAGTRLNMVAAAPVTILGVEASWAPDDRWTLRAGFERLRRTGSTPRNALALGASRRW